ncbi:TMV response-related protein [Iris pallida]|uniref:TMV response-related protein n=1 Tax=Iris pallida TaxID=29817 RepID=A0AAX6G7Q8_IRIPA|nr:TMV response-related protein [Iris pallida]
MAGTLSYLVAGAGFLAVSLAKLLLPRSSPLRRLSSLLVSSLFLLYSITSILLSGDDALGSVLPLPLLSLSSLFLLHSLSSLLLPHILPSSLLSLLSASSFSLELLLLSLRRVDATEIESRYFSLLSVPSLLCLLSDLASLFLPRSPHPRLARAAGLALHGTWLLQMAFSLFFSSAIAHGCFLKPHSSWSNYTVRCKGHAEYHRGRALATLQLNCHLALLLVAGVALYAFLQGRKKGMGGATGGYRPIGKEVQMMEGSDGSYGSSPFMLGSDEEDEGKAVAPPPVV